MCYSEWANKKHGMCNMYFVVLRSHTPSYQKITVDKHNTSYSHGLYHTHIHTSMHT